MEARGEWARGEWARVWVSRAAATPPLTSPTLPPLQVTADFAMREELVLKIAILAEKFAPNVQW